MIIILTELEYIYGRGSYNDSLVSVQKGRFSQFAFSVAILNE